MNVNFTPKGVCARNMSFDIEDGVIRNLKVTGGCNGNLKGIASLVEGMKIEDVAAKLEGIDCNGKGTSCPDQLAKAVRAYL
ncbi:MAG: TIGR03905 family TSCPD domain-containing protein [Oscillospiraceae bacterium]|nr:TIGR03905 family TSCPD domain-containing protein [Oscillospiraceae bacterium]MBP1568707.1 TIGR03905 family TSCPD domain-containing protein [Oscillospiraceae bacterium]MBP1591723.1 TIGR03905 family TSCPD domain-containing protein [Oscillospiraceae bacterium]MBQ5336065.1 TIGR03905 family TSCPD domain-containing protein [Oscillospiraceae bacterium]